MPSLGDRVQRDQGEAVRDKLRDVGHARRRVERALSGPSRLKIQNSQSRTRIRFRPARFRGVLDLVMERGAGVSMGMLMMLPLAGVGVVFAQIFLQPPILYSIAGGLVFLVGAVAVLAAFAEPYAGYSLVLEDGFVYVRGRGQLGYIAPLSTLEVVSAVGAGSARSPNPNAYIRYKPASVRTQGFWVRLNRDDTVRLRECIAASLRAAPEIDTDALAPAKPQKTWFDSLLWVVILGCGAVAAYLLWSAQGGP
ncbi:MAG: hypothetical protein AAFQ77_01455 [Myxococcota bacterium]